jgi:hypothetical protein
MTKLLEQAIERIRELHEADQDATAEMLLIVASRATAPEMLDDTTRAAVREGSVQARHGEFASEDEIAPIFNLSRLEE